MPDLLQNLGNQVALACGWNDHAVNSANLNLYQDGKQAVGWHSDNEPLFLQRKDEDVYIASLSFGATRTFEFKRVDGTGATHSINIADGDVVTMEGTFQSHFMHCITACDGVHDARFNITFRFIKYHESRCPLNNSASSRLHGTGVVAGAGHN